MSRSSCLIQSKAGGTPVTGAWLALLGTPPAFGTPSKPGMGDKIRGLELLGKETLQMQFSSLMMC